MRKAHTSIIVSIAMVVSSVSAIAADAAGASGKLAVQTGPLSPGGPVVVSPAQGTVNDELSCGYNGQYDIYGVCGPIVLLGVAGMGVALAAIMGVFAKTQPASSITVTTPTTTTTTTTGTGG